jgi:DNA-binding transcriptional LysR family regulator
MNLLGSLKYLVALDEHKHFGRAAQACHITQPALSNALRAIEQEFGCAIVTRGRSFIGFTPEGQRVLASARRMLHERECLQQDLQSTRDRPVGSLRIGVVPTAVPIAARFAARLQARHPAIAPVVLSLSSPEIEAGLESLSLDLGLGYTDRLAELGIRLGTLPQYAEHYFLVRRAPSAGAGRLRFGQTMRWAEAAELPLCLLTPDMHNRALVDGAFAAARVVVTPVIQTNSILTLALSVVAGDVCSVLPGALVGAVRGYGELEALPLADPKVLTPVGFMFPPGDRSSRTQEAAMALAREPAWMAQVAANSGALV